MKMIVDAGHEIGAHGYSHENPIAMSAKEEDVLLKSIELIEKISGKKTERIRSTLVRIFKYHQ